MPKAEWGTKRICPTTGKRFYDLNRTPVVSPYTGEVVDIESARRKLAASVIARVAPEKDDETVVDDLDTDDDLLETATTMMIPMWMTICWKTIPTTTCRWTIWPTWRATKKKAESCRARREAAAFSPCTPPRPPLHTRHAAATLRFPGGVIAQMGERLNGIQEVGSSILPGSTNITAKRRPLGRRFAFQRRRRTAAPRWARKGSPGSPAEGGG